MFDQLRRELRAFYLNGDAERAKGFAKHCFEIMDARARDGMTVTEQKLLQYDVICEEFEPVLFDTPFFYETGVLTSLSDGARSAKGYSFTQANGWVYERNAHLLRDQDPSLYERRRAQGKARLYLICGPYNDDSQHFNFNCRPFLEVGARGIYEKAKREMEKARDESEREFLYSVCQGMVALRRMAGKFAEKAERTLSFEQNENKRKNLLFIADAAKRIPWEAPKTFHEALAALAFLRTVMGSLEGAGPNTFGRIDKDLIGFYLADVASGRLTPHSAYDLVCQFLIIWDCHYDHDMLMSGYADHELENTYTLGGCDDDGNPLYNEVTRLFLRATREENIIFPKIKCRFSQSSPKEYLDEINRSLIKGTSTVLFQNDDATIPAILRAGRSLREARDYMITGCWGLTTYQEKFDHGSYLNLLKPFEFSVHDLQEQMRAVGIRFERFDDCENFEELYQRNLCNCKRILEAKLDITRRGGQILHKVDRFPIFSSTLEDCLENHRDYTMLGARYHDDYQLMFGFPNIVDSLLAIKELVWDQGKYTLSEFLTAVRADWKGYEEMRLAATRCHGWGDGSDASTALAIRFYEDLYKICGECVGTYGGKVHMGHLTYTEILFWGESTLATPDGRKSGEYFSQGLTPSRLKRIPCVNDVVNSMACLDPSLMGANSVINILLPSDCTLERCEWFLRSIAQTAVQSLQLNCVSRQDLLEAQRHPEKYPHLVVRVTGFSAKFTSLSREWQNEVISRNFYD